MSYKKYRKQYHQNNKYDKPYNTTEKIKEQLSFKPNSDFLLKDTFYNEEPEKVLNFNKNALPYYPLPSNEGYETFLKVMKKEQYSKTQYSLPFMLSLREKYKEKPANMKEIKIPQKNEIRSRAKVVTEEAYRFTRNYLDENSEHKNLSINYINKIQLNEEEINNKTKILREILNKITFDNYDELLNQILKFEYDEKLLEIFKNLIFTKILTEKKYFYIYINICIQMCKLYNKKTFSNEPKMNLKSILLISIQKEFLDNYNTNINYPFTISGYEKQKFIQNIKFSNIKLISEFYNNSLIPQKIISDCFEVLNIKEDSLSIAILCKLIIYTYKKLIIDGKDLLEKGISHLEYLFNNKNSSLNNKEKFFIMDILELKDKILKNSEELLKNEDALSNNNDYINLGVRKYGKFSNLRTRRKSSINPKNVEQIKSRTRFNSRVDELKTQKEEKPGLMDELVNYLETDIDFYKCFRLTDEEFDLIKEYNKKFLGLFKENNNDDTSKDKNIKKYFDEMMEEVQCEKFIAIGHLLEIMFSQNNENANIIMNCIIHFYKNQFICEEDIKHGIVLGLVNFKNNIIDYPNTTDYFQKFINLIKENNILDKKILIVYQRCCDNIKKYMIE
jgi:hypothetical protein